MADRTCLKCNMVFEYPSYYERHMKISSRCKNIIEPIPETIETILEPIEEHIPETIPEPILEQEPDLDTITNFKCNLCNKSYPYKRSLVRHHKDIHVNKKPSKPGKDKTLPQIPLPAITPTPIPETPATALPVAIPLPPPNMEGIYLVHTREFLNSNKPIYKIGRSSNIVNRTRQYPNGSNVLCMLCCENSVECEAKLIELFKVKFTQETFYGKEYFSGNKYDMIKQIFNYISSRYEISF